MNSEPKNTTTLDVTFKYTEDYNPNYVSGVWGGIGPHGELICHFYLDRQGLPKKQHLELDQTTGVVATTTTDPDEHERKIIRFVTSGIIMNAETARSFHQWLGEKIPAIEAIEKERAKANAQ